METGVKSVPKYSQIVTKIGKDASRQSKRQPDAGYVGEAVVQMTSNYFFKELLPLARVAKSCENNIRASISSRPLAKQAARLTVKRTLGFLAASGSVLGTP